MTARVLSTGCGWREFRRDRLVVTGIGAAAYLQGQLSADVAALGVGGAATSLLLEPDGKLVALVRVVRRGDDDFTLDVAEGFGAAAEARLRRFLLRVKVTLEASDERCVSLRGPLTPAVPGGIPVEWPGFSGVDLLGGAAEVPSGAVEVGPDEWERTRIEAGVPVMGRELVPGMIPAEAGIVERTVSFTKGCYTGQELVARIDSRGAKTPRRLVAFVGDGGFDEGDEVTVVAKVVGAVTSVARREGDTIGLGYLHRSVEIPSDVTIGGTAARAVPSRPAPPA